MGQAFLREFFAQVDSLVGIKPQTLTAATPVQSNGFDVVEHSASRAVLNLAFTTASGDEGDTYIARIKAESDDDDAFSDPEDLKEFEAELVIGDEDGDHSAVVMLPTKLLAAKRYLRYEVEFTADAGNTGTASAIVGALSIDLGGNITDPAEEYNRDGYAKVIVNG